MSFEDDYNKAWDQDSEQEEASTETVNTQEETPTVSKETPENLQTASTQSETQYVEPESSDPWATASDEIKAYRQKTENDLRAAHGRHDTNIKKIQELEQQAADYKKKLAQLEREPTTLETQHPDFAKDINQLIDEKLQPTVTQQAETSPTDNVSSGAETVLATHPDAGTIVNSVDFNTWVASQPGYINAALTSENPEMINSVLTGYKGHISAQAQALQQQKQNELNSLAEPNTTQSTPNLKTKADMTDEEAYEAEWENDD